MVSNSTLKFFEHKLYLLKGFKFHIEKIKYSSNIYSEF
jgi:hypothetical protein